MLRGVGALVSGLREIYAFFETYELREGSDSWDEEGGRWSRLDQEQQQPSLSLGATQRSEDILDLMDDTGIVNGEQGDLENSRLEAGLRGIVS